MSRMCKVWENLFSLSTGVHSFQIALLLKKSMLLKFCLFKCIGRNVPVAVL